MEKYVPEFSISDDILQNMSVNDIERLALVLNNICQSDLAQEDKQIMVKCGAPEILLKEDIKKDFVDGAN